MDRNDKGQWEPGQSGNPAGRPRFSLLSIVKEELQKIAEEDKEQFARQMIREYLKDAKASNDGVAIRDLIDRVDGKPKQSLEINNELDGKWLTLFQEIKDELIEPPTEADSQGDDTGQPEDTDT